MMTLEALRSVPLLSGLADSEIKLILGSARRRQYPKRSIVFQEGDAGDFLLIVIAGRIKVMLVGDEGQETIVSILGSGGFIGEISLLDEAPRSATVMTIEPTEFLEISRGPFLKLMTDRPAMALKVMRHLAGELRDANEQIRSLSMFDVYGRIVRCLLGIARKHGETDGTRILIRRAPSIQELSKMVGCSRETVSRALKTLQQTGYVTVSDDGLAVEQRGVRRYLQPTLQNFSPAASGRKRGSTTQSPKS
jgi:CRP/FNR family cyclic AMP-dependent transcriptional regulator